jgi:hypothetical protein
MDWREILLNLGLALIYAVVGWCLILGRPRRFLVADRGRGGVSVSR